MPGRLCGIVVNLIPFLFLRNRKVPICTAAFAAPLLTREVLPGTINAIPYLCTPVASKPLFFGTVQKIRWNTECRRKLGYISVSRQLGTQISHRLELPPTRAARSKGYRCPATAARQQLRLWSRSGPHQLQETKKGGYRDAPRRMNRWPRGQCQCCLRDTCGCE